MKEILRFVGTLAAYGMSWVAGMLLIAGGVLCIAAAAAAPFVIILVVIKYLFFS